MTDTEPPQKARVAALRFLSHRPRSEAEVRAHLQRRFAAPLVEQVMETLKEQDLVDDAKFASTWRESRETHSPRSAWAIKRELAAKGVDSEVATEAVRDLKDEESAYRAGLKQAGKIKEPDVRTFRRRLFWYLQRRGFSDSVSRRTIDRLWEDLGREGQPQGREER